MGVLKAMRARIGWVVIALVTVALALAATVFVVTRSAWARGRLLDLAVAQANTYLTATLSIGRVDGSLLRGVELVDVRLTRDGETLVAIDRVSLGYDIRELSRGAIVIRQVVLERPRVTARRRPDGARCSVIIRTHRKSRQH
jgi:uncharacterized protein involved in outer membrane biogenesis